MDNYQGDLTDIVRASSGVASLGQSHDGSAAAQPVSGWEFPPDHDPLDRESNVFGDPFMNIRDPLLHELNVAGSGYFSSCSNSHDNSLLGTTAAAMDNPSPTAGTSFCGANGGGLSAAAAHQHQRKVFDHHQEEMMQKASTSPSAMFSRIQISRNNPAANLAVVSPCESPVIAAVSSPRAGGGGFKTSAVVSTDMINANSSNNCLIENTAPALISSPRNLGIKRRKSQAKKVVCIPAPAAANSRPSGEVVPSDLWAWRKYGQKPIKGSPYPRGYYRCSSSKGCSARKQVERSRTDPNMLVITYTSEHNHPWPTQRNALAGSTRSQPPKNTAASKSSHGGQKGAANAKEEQKESSNDALSPTSVAAGSTASAPVKEEVDEMERQMEMEDNEFSEGFPQSYRPAMPPDSGCGGQQPDQDFFADLGEIEADPLDLLFTQGFSGDEQKDSQSLDPFSIFDWSVDTNNNITNTSSYGEAKRGL